MKWRSKREVPLEVIEKGLKDGDCDVRMVAYKIAKERGADAAWNAAAAESAACNPGRGRESGPADVVRR